MRANLPGKLSLVIPCFNEAESLPDLFKRLDELKVSLHGLGILDEYIIIDDGSIDTTWAMLNQQYGSDNQVRLIRHVDNIGFGGALKTGLGLATGDIVVSVDADTNYDLRKIPDMLAYFKIGFDVVTASPFGRGGRWNYPLHRFLLSKGVAGLYRLALGKTVPPLSVYTCGFRAYRREALDLIMPEANDFLATAEILVHALLAGLCVAEMPVTVHKRVHGVSKMKLGKTARRHLGFLWSLCQRPI